MHDPDRRFRNEPERVEVEQEEDLAPHAPGEQSWLPESNTGRAALAATVRAWRKTDGAGRVAPGGQDQVASALASPGAALDGRARQAAAASGMGELGGVRVHTDGHAAQAASALGARAFTVGSDVFFGAGHYAPGTAEGDRLLGHELAHAAQQRGASPQVQTKLEVSTPGDSMEQEADQAGDVFSRAARGHEVAPAAITGAGSMSIARDVEATHSTRRPDPAVESEAELAPAADLLSERQVAAAVRFNRGRNHAPEVWAQIAGVIGSSSSELGPELVQAIARFQSAQGFTVDGAAGDMTMQRLSQVPGGEGLDQYVQSNATVFVGMNPDSRGVELRTLQSAAGASNVTGVTGARQNDTARAGGQTVDLNDEAGLDAFVAQFDRLDAGRRDALRAFLQGSEGSAKDEMAQLATILYEAEMGQRLIKRMVLSGHSGGSSIWGESAVSFDHLASLKNFFPMAMGQVEDLMLSACNTGFQGNIPQYLAIFPNLRAIWAYEGYSPSAATGSTRHIREWEKASRGNATHEAMDAGRQRVARGSGKRDQNVAVWSREQGAESASYSSQAGSMTGFEMLKAEVDGLMYHYDDAYLVTGTIDPTALSDLYTRLQRLVGTYSAELGDQREYYALAMKHVLYLRHWDNITRHFMREHGAKVREAYQAAGLEVPAFAGMSRVDFLTHVNGYSGDRGTEGFRLVLDYLYTLDPEKIPDSWN